MRSHGWAGTTPASDEDAIARILDAADDVVAERGAAMRIADVARRLGVTRQTVYRYFPGTDALLIASAMRSANGFIDRLAERVGGEVALGFHEPGKGVVHARAFCGGFGKVCADRQGERALGDCCGQAPDGGDAGDEL